LFPSNVSLIFFCFSGLNKMSSNTEYGRVRVVLRLRDISMCGVDMDKPVDMDLVL
jgi:hypothetical protein